MNQYRILQEFLPKCTARIVTDYILPNNANIYEFACSRIFNKRQLMHIAETTISNINDTLRLYIAYFYNDNKLIAKISENIQHYQETMYNVYIVNAMMNNNNNNNHSFVDSYMNYATYSNDILKYSIINNYTNATRLYISKLRSFTSIKYIKYAILASIYYDRLDIFKQLDSQIGSIYGRLRSKAISRLIYLCPNVTSQYILNSYPTDIIDIDENDIIIKIYNGDDIGPMRTDELSPLIIQYGVVSEFIRSKYEKEIFTHMITSCTDIDMKSNGTDPITVIGTWKYPIDVEIIKACLRNESNVDHFIKLLKNHKILLTGGNICDVVEIISDYYNIDVILISTLISQCSIIHIGQLIDRFPLIMSDTNFTNIKDLYDNIRGCLFR